MRCASAAGLLAAALALPAAGAPAAPPAGAPAAPAAPRLDAGLSLYREGRYLEAMDHFLAAVEADPSDPRAREHQKRALDAVLSERTIRARQEAYRMMRETLDRFEADAVALRLARQGFAALESGNLLAADDLFAKAGALRAGHPEVRRGLESLGERVHRQMELLRGARDRARTRGDLEKLEGLAALLDSRHQEAVPHLEQALLLTSPGDASFGLLQQALERARRGLGGKAAAPIQAVPAPKAPAPRPRRVAPAVPAPPPAPPAPPAAAAGPDASNAAYLDGVAAYMAGRTEDARRSMERALELDPKNQRAKRMLERIAREQVR